MKIIFLLFLDDSGEVGFASQLSGSVFGSSRGFGSEERSTDRGGKTVSGDHGSRTKLWEVKCRGVPG